MADSNSSAIRIVASAGEQTLVAASPGWKWVLLHLESGVGGEHRMRIGDGSESLYEAGDTISFLLAGHVAVTVTSTSTGVAEWSVIVTQLSFLDRLSRALAAC